MKYIIALAAIISLVGCSFSTAHKKTSLYSEEAERTLYIIRPDNKVGSLVGQEIFVNDEEIATMKINTFLAYPIFPGKYTLRIGEGTLADLYFAQEIQINLTKGDVCIILHDEFIDDERGPHISLKPVPNDPAVCTNNASKFKKIKIK